MKTDRKKLLLFAVIIGLLNSVYVSLVSSVAHYGWRDLAFVGPWLHQIPIAYAIVLPFLLLTGPPVRKLIDGWIKS